MPRCRPPPATCRSSTIGLWSDGPKSSVPAKVQARPCARQRSRRKGTTLPPKCVISRGPTSEKAGDQAGADRVVIADDRRRLAVQRRGDAQQLAAVQELAVRQMDVGEGDLADLHDLAAPARQAAGQGGRRQRQHLGRREIVPAPDREAVDTAGPGQRDDSGPGILVGSTSMCCVTSCMSSTSGRSRSSSAATSPTAAPSSRNKFQLITRIGPNIDCGQRSVHTRGRRKTGTERT